MTCASDTVWTTECQLVDERETDGSLKPTSQYKTFICIISNTQNHQSQATALMVTLKINRIYITSSQPNANMQIIALANPGTMHFAVIDEALVSHVSHEEIEFAAQAFLDGQPSQLAPSAAAAALTTATATAIPLAPIVQAACGDFPIKTMIYSFKSPEKELVEDLKKGTEDLAKRLIPSHLNPYLAEKMPLLESITNQFPALNRWWDIFRNYLLGAAGIVNWLDIAYEDALRNSVSSFQSQPNYDFTDCLVMVNIELNELLKDMQRQGILTRRVTSLNTISEISSAFNVSDGEVKSFQTTARLAGFADNSAGCQCPVCPGTDFRAARGFDNCDADVQMQTDLIELDWLRLVNSNYEANMMTPGNATNPDGTLTTFILMRANLIGFDSPLNAAENSDNEQASTTAAQENCRCQSCPPLQTEASKKSGGALLSFTNLCTTFVIASAGYALIHGVPVIFKKLYH